jgi:hypothetical protein
MEHLAEVIKSGWIRPEDLHHYVDAGISVFKIAGREMYKPDFLRVVDVIIREVLIKIYGSFSDVSLLRPALSHWFTVKCLICRIRSLEASWRGFLRQKISVQLKILKPATTATITRSWLRLTIFTDGKRR